MSRRPDFDLLLVTDRHAAPELVATVRAALAGAAPGRVAVMLREKDLPGGPLLELARELRRVTREAGAYLLVNDRLDVALAAGADGLHLPVSGLPSGEARRLLGVDAWIGRSTHGPEQVARAEAEGVDYVTFGPVYDTPSKRPYGPPLGPEALRTAGTRLPVYALGGVDATHAAEVMAAGASGVACIRAVLAALDPAAVVRSLLSAVDAARRPTTG